MKIWNDVYWCLVSVVPWYWTFCLFFLNFGFSITLSHGPVEDERRKEVSCLGRKEPSGRQSRASRSLLNNR